MSRAGFLSSFAVFRPGRVEATGDSLRRQFTHQLSKIVHWEARGRNRRRPTRCDTVLIVRLDAIGDFILFRPSLRYFRNLFPGQRLVLLTAGVNADLLANEALVDRVITVQRGRFLANPFYQRTILAELGRIRPAVTIYPAYTREGFVDRLVYASGARERLAFRDVRTGSRRVVRRNAMYTRLIEPDPVIRHEVERNREFLEKLGAKITDYELSLAPSGQDRQLARDALRPLDSHGGLVVLAPGASAARKRWPPEYFIEVARQLLAAHPVAIALVGSGPEKAIGGTIAAAIGGRCVNLIGATTLLQAYSVMEQAVLYVGNDTGPKHLAAAAKVPVLEIGIHLRGADDNLGDSPLRFSAWGVPTRVFGAEPLAPCQGECRATEAHCITNIKPDAVAAAALEMLATKL